MELFSTIKLLHYSRPTPYLPGATRASWAEMPRNWTAPHIFLAHCTLYSQQPFIYSRVNPTKWKMKI